MSIEQKRRIDWFKSSRQLAQMVWGIATYFGLLAVIAWGAVAIGGDKPAAVAVLAVFNSTMLHWMVFTTIERKSSN